MSFDGMISPGRNDECWCGSGRKYKKCKSTWVKYDYECTEIEKHR